MFGQILLSVGKGWGIYELKYCDKINKLISSFLLSQELDFLTFYDILRISNRTLHEYVMVKYTSPVYLIVGSISASGN